MRTAPSPAESSRVVIAAFVAMALLFAQWAGLAHSIAHADGRHEHRYFASSSPQLNGDHDDDSHHSCVEFDAATLAASVYTTPFIAPFLPNVHVLALWIAFASWDVPFTCHFSSRAPPLA